MIKSKGRRITWFVLTLILAMGMVGSSVFAAADGTTGKRMDNGKQTPGTTLTNSGWLTLHKTFTKDGDTWPNKDNFTYTIEKVKAWDNSNESTALNGHDIGKDKMPLPTVNANKELTGSAIDARNSVEVKVPLDAANNGVKTGQLGNVQFDFERPGYYLYKITEVDDEVNGVVYDYHTYYVSFFVANKTVNSDKDGETTGGTWINDDNAVAKDGIYVHTITVFRSATMDGTNQQEIDEEYIPNLVDPAWNNDSKYFKQVLGKDIEAGKTYYTRSGSSPNYTYTKIEDNSTITQDQKVYEEITPEQYTALAEQAVEKVGKSGDGEGNNPKPNEATVKFWNETKSGNIEVEKKVTGTLGDLNKKFEFTVVLGKLAANTTYTVNLKGNDAVDAAEIMENGGLTAVAGTTTATFTTDANGAATIKFKMKAKQKVQLKDLAQNAEYTVTEAASDHRSKVDVTGNGDNPVIATANAANDQPNTAISTAKECVDATDGKVIVLFTNHRDFETETGIPSYVFPIVLAAMLALIGLAVMRRRNSVSSVNDFEF